MKDQKELWLEELKDEKSCRDRKGCLVISKINKKKKLSKFHTFIAISRNDNENTNITEEKKTSVKIKNTKNDLNQSIQLPSFLFSLTPYSGESYSYLFLQLFTPNEGFLAGWSKRSAD